MAWSSVPLRSLKVMLVSTQRPSTWWKMGECVASCASLRWTLPGMTMRTGGGCCSMVRICTGEVWVRSSRRSRCERRSWLAMTSVSCVSRAGWPGGKFMRLEVVEVGFDFGADADGVAESREDGDDFVQRARDGVLGSGEAARAGQRDVDGFGGERGIAGTRAGSLVEQALDEFS